MLALKRWLITVLFLVTIIVSLGFVKFTQIKAAIAFGESFPEASETVQATQATWSNYQPTVSIIGELKPIETVDIRNEVEGILTKVNVQSGAAVQKGDLLFQFNVDTEQAQLDAIKAEINLAELDVKRFTDLLDVRASSKEQLDRSKAQLAVTKARARGIEAEIDKLTLYAPISGTTSIHDWQVGTYVPANSMMINIVGNSEAMWVDFNLPQIYADIAIGTEVTIISRSADQTSNVAAKASLVALNQQFNATSRTLQARAKIEQKPVNLKPGAIVSVIVPTGMEVSAIPLPNQAIRYDTFGAYVFALEKDDNGDFRACRKPVNVLSKQEDVTYISNGIEAGETIATIGSAKLRPNLLTYVSEKTAQ